MYKLVVVVDSRRWSWLWVKGHPHPSRSWFHFWAWYQLWRSRTQKPQARHMTSGNEHLQVKMNRLRIHCVSMDHTTVFLLLCFLLIFLLLPLLLLLLLLKPLLLVLFLCFIWFWVLLLNLVLFGDGGARAEGGCERLGRCMLWKPQGINERNIEIWTMCLLLLIG